MLHETVYALRKAKLHARAGRWLFFKKIIMKIIQLLFLYIIQMERIPCKKCSFQKMITINADIDSWIYFDFQGSILRARNKELEEEVG